MIQPTPDTSRPARGGRTSHTAPRTPGALTRRQATIAVLVCWLLVVFDGYDLIVFGTVQSSLVNDTDWGLTDAGLGVVGSMAFVGMMIGALFAGRLADALGRRRTILACAITFSVFTILCAFAPSAWVFGAFRLVAGIGLGGLVPSANAMVAELVPDRWRSSIATLMMSGVPIGGSLAALIGIPMIPALGWPSMFLVAAIALVVVVPLGFAYLPETLASEDRARKGAAAGTASASPERVGGYAGLLRQPYLLVSIMFALATLATLFAWYGLGTWLPRAMESLGYNLGSALTFSLSLNIGAVMGSIVTAWAGDRYGAVKSGVVAAALAGVALLALLFSPPVWLVYVILMVAGVGTHGTQCLIIAAVSNHYPGYLRGTALGWALGVGRLGAVTAPLVAGFLLNNGYGAGSLFVAFGIAAGLAAILQVIIIAQGHGGRSTDRGVQAPAAS
ncbi:MULTISPECIES: aromatic acid/H+ symport family MFS transporter [Micrococcaceae]|uniref:MFS transporter n=1 Tax=Micrococcaceae TaxID=1268 RepID=UPI00160C7F8D|nr:MULTISPECIES: aromatic acid/H+ symport family MFS transporter [Micrococcaceae]MBB5748764.1 AAHS family benzoate transporter-like MFS transporter [Micrococcus sp. TA1]HRO29035.1 aromatic acid/H+ symport family MFS transporter [Citricoccus sp.]HRO93391.1 aromatic acid/H+ symport family MFS transporter [Citricoccus sp.]